MIHYIRGDVPTRFWAKVAKRGPDDCWLWLGGKVIGGGYGNLKVAGKQIKAHRISYELAHGPIPDGLEVDHICHNRDTGCLGGPRCPHRACVNPAHLEAVSHSENATRGRSGEHNRRRTHCKWGHELTPENTYTWAKNNCRACKICRYEAMIRAKRKHVECHEMR